MAPCYDAINNMTIKLIEEYKIWGSEINKNKTEYMCVEGQQQDLMLNDNITIKHCNDYKYLGTNIPHHGTLGKAI